MAGSSSLLSLAAMAVLLVGLAAARGPSPSKSPPSPSPTPHRRLLAIIPRVIPKGKEPFKPTEGVPNTEGVPSTEGILEGDLNTKKTPPYDHIEVPDLQTNSSTSDPRPPAPPVTPAHQLSYATLLAGEPAPGHSGAVSGRLGFGFAWSVAIGALVAGLVI